jgi:type VI secretion system protein ImpK
MRLSDCFAELIAYTLYFQKSVENRQPPYEQVKADVLRSLAKSEDCVKKGLFPEDQYDMARFAVCAWVDEAILNSTWQEKEAWKREQLQRMYYHTTEAGEEFFDRLNTVDFYQKDVREVYYLCLAMGFVGRYIRKGDEFLLDQLKSNNLKILLGSSVGLPSLKRGDLFPDAYPTESAPAVPQKRRWHVTGLLIAACLAGPVLLYGALYLVYRFILAGVGGHFLKMVS